MANADSRNTIATALIGLKVDLKGLTRGFSRARGLTSRLTRGLQRLTGRATRGFLLMTAAAKRFGRVLKSVLLGPLAFVPGPLAALFGIGAAAAGLGISAKRFADFEQGMARVKAITGATGLEFAKLQGLALELGRTTQFSASQAAEAMGFFSVAGFKVNEQLTAMRPTLNLAAAGQLDMGTAADIVAKIMRGMSLDASQLEETVDVLAKAFTTANTDLVQLGEAFKFVGPIGKSTGKGIKELAAAIQVMSDVGIQGGMAGAALRNILLRLQVQPSEVRKALEKMNVEIGDSEGKMRSLADIVDDLNRGLSSMTDIQRGATVAQIGGIRAASALNEILSVGGDRLREYEKRLKDSAGTAARIAAVQMDTLKGSFIRFKSALEGAAITIGKALKPALNTIAESLANLAPSMGEFVSQIKPLATQIGQNVATALERIGKAMQNNIGTFRSATEGIADFVFLLTNDFPKAFDQLGNLLKVAYAGIGAGFQTLLVGMVEASRIAAEQIKKDFIEGLFGKDVLKQIQRNPVVFVKNRLLGTQSQGRDQVPQGPTQSIESRIGAALSGTRGTAASTFESLGGPEALQKLRDAATTIREQRQAQQQSQRPTVDADGLTPSQREISQRNALKERGRQRVAEQFGGGGQIPRVLKEQIKIEKDQRKLLESSVSFLDSIRKAVENPKSQPATFA